MSYDKCALKMAAQVRRVASSLGYDNLRPLQVEVITAFVGGRDVFVSLPTGVFALTIVCVTPAVRPSTQCGEEA